MKRKNMIEKRKTQRLNIHLQSKYRLSFRGKLLIQEIFTKNISGGGIGLTLKQPLKIGTKLRALLYFPTERQPISSLSKVVWCRKVSKKDKVSFDVGIKHVKIAAKDRERFVYLFCETMINYFLISKKITYHGEVGD